MATAKTVPFTNVVKAVSTNAGVPATDAGKAIRRHIRANKATLAKDWPALAKHEQGNRYPDLPAAFAKTFVAGRVATMKSSS